MSFIIRNKTNPAVPVLLDDLGIEIPAGADYDMLDENAADVQASGQTGGHLNDAVLNGTLVVVDQRDLTGATELNASDSLTVIQVHNDPNWGIRGAVLNDLDDVDTTGLVLGDVLQVGGGGQFSVVTPAALAADIALGDLSNVTDGTTPVDTEFYILKGDAGKLALVAGSTDIVFVPFIEDTVGNVVSGGAQSDITLTYNTATNKIDVAVADNFLKNTGDTLDSGTLNIAAGASLVVATGGVLTIADAPVNGIDGANKDYVDSVAQGADVKDSVHHATTPADGDIGGVYSAVGGTGGTGAFTGALDTLDGQLVTLNDRIIIKDQTDPLQNGIYVVTAVGGGTADYERAPDHDGSPASEVSAGNLAFVEIGAVNGNTSWIVTGSGQLTLNTDPINWTQFSGAGTYSNGPGLGLNGTQFYLDIANLNSITVAPLDEIAFNDANDPGVTKKSTFADVIIDLGLYTSANLTASDGVLITGGDIQLDITSLPAGAAPSLTAEMVFYTGVGGAHNKATVGDFFNGLDVPYGITTDGILVRTANDTYTSRAITASVAANEQGILLLNGDGIAGDPTVGLDIVGLTASANSMSSTDTLVMSDGSNNIQVTGQQVADGVSAILGGLGNAYTTIQGDTGSATAGTSTDTLAFVGATNGGIVTVATDSAPDTVTFALDISLLATGAGVDLTDTLAVGEGAATVAYTFQDVVTDLDIATGLGALTGLIVSDGAGNLTSTSIAVDGVGALDGLIVANADGVAGPPTVGLDINGNALAGEILAPTDKVIAYNASGVANEAFTGQEVADGVSTMLGFGGLAVSTINGQEVLTLIDTTRANKILSITDSAVTWAENRVGNNDWLQIGSAVDAASGYIVPMNATIVKITAHCEDDKSVAKVINLYINNTLIGPVGNFPGLGGEATILDTTLDINVAQGEKLRLRGGGGGRIEDTVITLWLKWHVV